MKLNTYIRKTTDQLFDELVDIRRHLHAHPELSFQEEKTSLYVKSFLDREGIAYQDGYCKYGIVAEIKGKSRGGIVYLRGDMDALPIQETNKHSYKSKVPGVMHACGHDVHTTSLLGAAIILNKLRDKLKGTIRFIFQPGEEKLPGGASIMIKEGAIKDADKAVIYGQHVHPPLDAGKVGFRQGEYMASADELYFKVKGRGGHAALPQDCIDTILVASELVSSMHQLVSRYSNPQVPTVLSLGKIYSDGGATNVIPDEVHIHGTLRSMDENNRREMHRMIRQLANHTCKAYGAKVTTKIKYGYPTLYNNPALVDESMAYAREYMGKENVVYLEKRMTAEDFAYFSQMMPACFYRLGTGNKLKGTTSPVHTSDFDIDESTLHTGAGLLAYLACRKLGNV